MLDIALVNFVGAGLTSFAPVFNLSLPHGAMTDGAELLRQLHKSSPEKTATGRRGRRQGDLGGLAGLRPTE